MSKFRFKSYVKKKVREAAFSDLLNIKNSHKKGENISYDKFQIQSYLKSSQLSYDQKCLLFNLRSRMTPVKANFSSMFDDTTCKNCEMNVPESDSHLLECTKMIEECQALYDDDKTEYFDIFETMASQIPVTKLYFEIFKIKKKMDAA